MKSVIVLNADYSFLSNIDWQRSVVLLYQNKAEVVKESSKIVYNIGKTFSCVIPKVIRLINYVTQVHKNKLPYSKSNIFIRDKYTCQYCMKKMKSNQCTVDHVIPKAKGGKSTWLNCVTSCRSCNSSKGDMDLKDFRYVLLREPYQPTVSDFIRLRSNKHIIDTLQSLW